MILVSTYQELLDNARSFVASLEHGCSFLILRLSLFRRWYYFPELEMFAPSKFVGYVGMTCERYQTALEQGADGRETENHIKQAFQLVNETEQKIADLAAFLARYDKRPNAKASIHMITGRKN